MGPSHAFQPRGGAMGDPCIQQFRPPYQRLPPQTSSCIYPSSSQHALPFPSSYPAPHPPPVGEYFVGHVLSSSTQRPMSHQSYGHESNYACFGAPLTHGFPVEGVRAPLMTEGGSSSTQVEGRDWS